MLTKQGTKKLDGLATEILKEMIKEEPRLKIYS
jgi:ribosomal protein S19E (S16A)